MKLNIRPSFLLLETLIILWYLNPVASLLPSYTVIIVFAAWFFWEIVHKKNMKKILSASWINFIIFVVVVLRCYLAGHLDLDNFYSPIQIAVRRYEVFACSALAVYVYTLNREDRDKIFTLSILSMLITVIFSLYYLIFVDPVAIRFSFIDQYWGIADFQYIYAIAIFIGPFTMLAFDKSRVCKFRMLCIVTVILMYICILMCNLVTSVVIATVSFALSFLLEYKFNIKGVLASLAIIIGFFGKNIMGRVLIKISQSNTFFHITNSKLITIANLLVGQKGDLDTLDNRIELMSRSIKSFKENPLLGISFNKYNSRTVGSHHQWADDLARYGILGNVIIIMSYIKLITMNFKNANSSNIKNSLATAWIMLFILGFLNPCLTGQALAIPLIVIPCMYDSISLK